LAFAKVSMNSNGMNYVLTDAVGKFSFTVPRGERGFQVSYLGYNQQGFVINSPYVKVALYPQDVAMEELPIITGGVAANYGYAMDAESINGSVYNYEAKELNEVAIMSSKRERKASEMTRQLLNMTTMLLSILHL
jgi:hypothetical protein